jgi:POT family proton-dependent oligopeptide transporter
MKSFVMALYFGSITLGTFFTYLVNKLNAHDGKLYLEGATYYMFFTWLMLAASVLFIVAALRFKSRAFIQEESSAQS